MIRGGSPVYCFDESCHSRFVRSSRPGDGEHLDSVVPDELVQKCSRIICARCRRQMKTRLVRCFGEFCGRLGTTGEFFANRENDGSVRVADVPFRPLLPVLPWSFLQVVVRCDGAVLGTPTFGAPAAMRNSILNGPVQRSPVCAGLAAGNDSLDHTDCLHFGPTWVETEMQPPRRRSPTNQNKRSIAGCRWFHTGPSIW